MTDVAKGPNATKEDKNPRGGLSAKGRAKFGVKKGVVSYGSASRADKGRWVSWAMRFTGTPKPVKNPDGSPTRYALMFRAWGEKVPTSAADVRAVHAKAVTRSKQLKAADKASGDVAEDFLYVQAECDSCDRIFHILGNLLDHVEVVHLKEDDDVTETKEAAREFKAGERKAAAGSGAAMPGGGFPIKTKADLKNAIQALGRAKNPAAAKAHIVRRAKALGATNLLPPSWKKASGDKASVQHDLWSCPEAGCERAFAHPEGLYDHADSVHTFSDIQQAVQEEIREKFGRRGDYRAEPPIPSIYAWVQDLAEDWVVFMIDGDGGDSKLMKASYEMSEAGAVTLGTPVEVVRRTVYDTVGTTSSTTGSSTSTSPAVAGS